ncbi:uncharacterized protein METZ01_LOCUS320215, partial [marine metagenome]
KAYKNLTKKQRNQKLPSIIMIQEIFPFWEKIL